MADKPVTQKDMAEALGVHVKTFSLWEKRPDAPQGRNLDEWKVYIGKNELGKPSGSQELRDEKLRREIQILDAKLDREHRKVIDRDEVNRLLLHISSQQRTRLYQFMDSEAAPKLDGMSAVQMRPILREFADSLCDTMAAMVEDFEKA